jgi:cell division protein FtsB
MMDTRLFVEISVGIVSLVVAYLAFRQSSRAEHHKKMQVDAGAYERAKDIYEAVIRTLEANNRRLEGEISNLHSEVTSLRGEVVKLRNSNAVLSAEIASMRA